MMRLICTMFILYAVISFFRCNCQDNVVIKPDGSHSNDVERPMINIRVPNMDICQEINRHDCKSLAYQILKCQQIIFNDPGFSYQEYRENIRVHRQILVKYQSTCEGTQDDHLVNDFF